MAKREFLMLSHTFDQAKHPLGGHFVSEKMDGQRVFWDGGISRGIPVQEIPYSNTAKDDRFLAHYVATGLWSRNGKVLRAPDWWLDRLPCIMLDGEVWAGHGKWEQTAATVKDIRPDDKAWQDIKFWVFDTPPAGSIFAGGQVGSINDLFYKNFDDALDWVMPRVNKLGVRSPVYQSFESVNGWLKNQDIYNDTVNLLPQSRLPFSTPEALKLVDSLMDTIVSGGGEGLMIRNPSSIWTPARSYNLLKIKRWYDAEGTVSYYTWGKKTDRGSKRLGIMGNIGVEWNNKMVEICGFSHQESQIYFPSGGNAFEVGKVNPGKRIQDGLVNPLFPIGSKITFRYRELTAAGIPKNANFHRKFVEV